MTNAADFPTYEAYREARLIEGATPISKMLWEVLKEAIEDNE